MLELPGLTHTGDAAQDLESVRRYLSRLVPDLEMELANLKQDRYQEAMNALTQNIGTADKNTTAGALAAHELRTDNPHKVTGQQLGLSLGKVCQGTVSRNAMTARIGEKRGIQISAQDMEITVSAWQQHGGVAYADADLGTWAAQVPLLISVRTDLRGGLYQDYWAGCLRGTDRENIGILRIYRECDIQTGDYANNSGVIRETRVIPLTVIGTGVFGYGEQ